MGKLDQERFFRPAGADLVCTDRDGLSIELKKYRLRAGLTQRQLGELWGVSRYTIIRAEGSKTITWQSAYRIFTQLAKCLAAEDRL